MNKDQSKPTPPLWIDRLLEWYCSEKYIEEVQGDLHEWYERRIQQQGLWKAKLYYLLDVILFVRSYRLKSYDEFTKNSNNAAMFKNYFITSWRALTKNKAFSIINILGLTISMVAFMLISLYVQHEHSYDQFHTYKDRVYRLQQNRYNKGELTTQWAAGCAGVGYHLKSAFPEIESYAVMTQSNALLSYGDKAFKEMNAYYSNSAFFDLFSIPILSGDTAKLNEQYQMMISETTAKKYFGDEDPIGKTMRHNGERDFNVAGVYADIPHNSHLAVDVLFSFETYVDIVGEDVRTEWNWDGFFNYIKVAKNTDIDHFKKKIPDLIEEKIGEEYREINQSIEFSLQPITDIHLNSDYMMEFKPNGNAQATNFLMIVAFFIIIIAWINYVNLSTAKSIERAKEVGIRKVMGSVKGQLIRQFLVESAIVNFISITIAVLLGYIILPYFGVLAGRTLVLDILNMEFLSVLLGLFLVGTILSGGYPAFVMSGFRPVAIMSGNLLSANKKGGVLRKSLVTFQFVSSLVLSVGTYIVYQQLNYMQSEDLGIDISRTLVVRGPNATDSLYDDHLNIFKSQLSKEADISAVVASTAIPGSQPEWNAGGIRLLSQPNTESNQYRVIGMDDNFIDTYGLQIVEGRKFDKENGNENENVIFNESAVKLIGFEKTEEALNKEIHFWGDTFSIVGVVKDFHHESLKKSYEPLIFRYIPSAANFYSVRVSTDDLPYTIDKIEKKFNAEFPGNPFDFFFLDDHFDKQYRADQQFGTVFGLFASIAIIIACLGLFGLTSYMTTIRTKEIGVRKVLGATLPGIMILLSKDFVKLMLIAITIAIPASWYIMNDWLSGFAYHIPLVWWVFFIPILLLGIILFATVSIQTIKAGNTNPADVLKQE